MRGAALAAEARLAATTGAIPGGASPRAVLLLPLHVPPAGVSAALRDALCGCGVTDVTVRDGRAAGAPLAGVEGIEMVGAVSAVCDAMDRAFADWWGHTVPPLE